MSILYTEKIEKCLEIGRKKINGNGELNQSTWQHGVGILKFQKKDRVGVRCF